jgi:glycerol-3-phosphate dehydrogenase
LSSHALAVTPPNGGAPTYFLHPWKGRLLIGTGHSAWDGSIDDPCPSGEQIQAMIDDVNSSIPSLNLAAGNIDRILAGILPAAGKRSAELSKRPVIHDHATSGGPRGLVSVSGVKFTTARRVAAKTLDAVFGVDRAAGIMQYPRPEPTQDWQSSGLDFSLDKDTEFYLAQLSRLITEESALNLLDVIFRRTDLWERPAVASMLAPKICDLFPWSDRRKAAEIAGLTNELEIDFRWSLKE